MPSSHENNKRIAKNTMLLYFRSGLTMFVSFFTTRLILQNLGVSDYGIYNIVGGVIAMAGVLTNALNQSNFRFFNTYLGQNDYDSFKRNFSIILKIHLIVAIILLLLFESVGLWFVNSQLNILDGRMNATNWAFQFAVLGICINIVNMPYSSAITAHERFNFLAYWGIVDSVLKLLLVLALGFVPFDRLKTYSAFMLGMSLLTFLAYKFYCYKNFPETHFISFWDKNLFIEKLKFNFWVLMGTLIWLVCGQGSNFLLNRSYGTALNAANGIASQVYNGVSTFCSNLVSAYSPQIIKYYSAGDIENMYLLVTRGTKFTLLLLLVIAVPAFIQLDFVLSIWLVNVPDYASIFCKLIFINLFFFYSIGNLSTVITAVGKIKAYYVLGAVIQVFVFILVFLNVELSPIVCVTWLPLCCLLSFIPTLFLAKHLVNFPIFKFIKSAWFPVFFVFCLSVPLPYFMSEILDNWAGFFATIFSFLAVFVPSSWFFALAKNERGTIMKYVKKKLQ